MMNPPPLKDEGRILKVEIMSKPQPISGDCPFCHNPWGVQRVREGRVGACDDCRLVWFVDHDPVKPDDEFYDVYQPVEKEFPGYKIIKPDAKPEGNA